MQASRYVVVYDSSDFKSPRHLIPRNARDDDPLCGVSLGGRRNMRHPGDPLTPADCLDCLLVHAEAIANVIHGNQDDFDGTPHLDHVCAVVYALDGDKEAQVVAWIHDVLEDSSWTTMRLREEHIPPHMIEAVRLLTWNKMTTARRDYIERIGQAQGSEGILAQKVKLTDLRHNISRSTGERLVRYVEEAQYIERHGGV
jgi:hypothetical protein